MTDTHSMHRDAMQIADQAIEARRADRGAEARSLFRQACQLESQAAMALAEETEAEPTRSVLFRSAATLALNGELPGYAAYLLARGLEGTPPAEIREELREVLKSIRPERELLSEASFPTGAADRDRWERFLSASSDLTSTLDNIWRTLAETGLAAKRLSNFLIRRILGTARGGLQKYAPGADFSLSLFVLSPSEAKTWVSAPPSDALSGDWQMAAGFLFAEQQEAMMLGCSFADSTQGLANCGVLSAETAENLLEVGVRGATAWPVYTLNDKGKCLQGLVLLSLTSDPAIFADDLVRRLLRQTVSLLELGIIIGQRDELLAEGWEPERDAPEAD
jgi:hypothetical protein